MTQREVVAQRKPLRDNELMKRIVARTPTSSIKTVQSAFLAKGVKVSDMCVSRRLRYNFR